MFDHLPPGGGGGHLKLPATVAAREYGVGEIAVPQKDIEVSI
jgi:hypothetical protein